MIRMAFDASCNVYGVLVATTDNNDLLEFENDQHTRVVSKGSGCYLRNTKNWALFTSKICTIFAIRGTATTLDHVVNMDCESVPFRSGSQVLWSAYSFVTLITFPWILIQIFAFNVHSGMANIANAMLPILLDILVKYRDDIRPTLILTGHSSGGGIASLLYELLVHKSELNSFRAGMRLFVLPPEFSNDKCIQLRSGYAHIHCLTFGSAAVMSTAGTSLNNSRNAHISFINLDDPVPRMDLAYANWAAKALAEVYNREHSDEVEHLPLDPPPPQALRPSGTLVLLTKAKAAQISDVGLARCLFLTLEKHNVSKYKQQLAHLCLI